MPKKRTNITLDEWVKDELDRREDVNISGAANEFFKRYISGDDGEQIAKEMRIKRLQEKEAQAQEEAQQYRAEWQALESELEEERAEKEDTLADAVARFGVVDLHSTDGLMVDAKDEELRPFADTLDMSIDELRQHIIERSEADA